jgi:hypothetical protein
MRGLRIHTHGAAPAFVDSVTCPRDWLPEMVDDGQALLLAALRVPPQHHIGRCAVPFWCVFECCHTKTVRRRQHFGPSTTSLRIRPFGDAGTGEHGLRPRVSGLGTTPVGDPYSGTLILRRPPSPCSTATLAWKNAHPPFPSGRDQWLLCAQGRTGIGGQNPAC